MDNLFFIISKLAWGLLSPSCLFIWLLLLATLLLWLDYHRLARKILLLLSIAGAAMMAFPFGDYLMYPLESRFSRPKQLPASIDGIVVLGGAEQLKLSISWDSAETGKSTERIISAATMANIYPDVPVIYSGGSKLLQMQHLDKQGKIIRYLLKQVGIAPRRIVIDPQARNSYENFVRIKALLPKTDGRYLLITSAFHMPRAVGIAQKQGIQVIPYPVDYRSSPPDYRQLDFELLEHLNVLETAWHEWLGLTVYFITDKTSAWLPQQQQTKAEHTAGQP